MPAIHLSNTELAALVNRTAWVYNRLTPEAKVVVRHLTAAPDAEAWFLAQHKIVDAMEDMAEHYFGLITAQMAASLDNET